LLRYGRKAHTTLFKTCRTPHEMNNNINWVRSCWSYTVPVNALSRVHALIIALICSHGSRSNLKMMLSGIEAPNDVVG
jgi:hypothetical protein